MKSKNTFRRRRIRRRFKGKNKFLKNKNPLGRGIPNSSRLIRLDIEIATPVVIGGAVVPAGLTASQYVLALNFPGFGNVSQNTGSVPVGWNNLSTITYSGAPAAESTVNTRLFGATAIFDEYRVMRLVVKFVPSATPTVNIDASATSTNWGTVQECPPVLYHFNDLDDAAVPNQTGTPSTSQIEGFMMNNGAYPKSYSNGNPIRFTYPQIKEKKKFFFNCGNNIQANNNPGAAAGLLTNLQTIPDPFGSMKLVWITQVNASQTIYLGRLYAKWECIFRGITTKAQ